MYSGRRTTTPSTMHAIIERALTEGRSILTAIEAGEILGQSGINVIISRLVETSAEAVSTSLELGFPVALKIASPDIIHKSDAGGVRLGLKTGSQVGAAFGEIMDEVRRRAPEASLQGVYVQPMAPTGTEVIIGMKRDAQFGPVLMFGLGGVWVEVLQDVSLRVTPINRQDAAEMIREIEGYPLLAGYHGGEPVDTACLEEMILALGELAREHTEISEVDLNPVIAGYSGAVAVDAYIVLKDKKAVEN